MPDRVEQVRRALVGAFRDGIDVAEVLVMGAVAAERRLSERGQGASLTDHRPGSWEASLLGQILESGGAYIGRGAW